MPELKEITAELSAHCPDILRWCGAIATKLRQFNVAIDGKSSGSSNTDALTLADLTVQELAVAAMRDRSTVLQSCRIEADGDNGALPAFAS